MVITAVVLSLTLFVMVNQRFSQQKFTLQRSAHQLAQDIRRAQEMAMSGRECPECAGQIPRGYGIYLRTTPPNNTFYILYADMTSPYKFYNDVGDVIIEDIQLENNVEIKSLIISFKGIPPGATTPNRLSLNFEPPDPLIVIKSSSGQTSRDIAEITLGLEFGISDTKKITVNKAGLIEIE